MSVAGESRFPSADYSSTNSAVGHTVDTTPAGWLVRRYQPWVLDIVVGALGPADMGARIYSVVRGRGLTSGWAVMGDTLICHMCGYKPGSDAARRKRLALEESGWLVRLDSRRGGEAAKYMATVPTDAILKALEIGLLRPSELKRAEEQSSEPPDIASGVEKEFSTPHAASGVTTECGTPHTASATVPPTLCRQATPDRTSGENRHKSVIKSSSMREGAYPKKDDDLRSARDKVDSQVLARIVSACANKKVPNLEGYIAATLRNAGLLASDSIVSCYMSAVQQQQANDRKQTRQPHQYPFKLREAAKRCGVELAGRHPSVVAAEIKSMQQDAASWGAMT